MTFMVQDPGLQTNLCQGRQQSEQILQDNQLLKALIPATHRSNGSMKGFNG